MNTVFLLLDACKASYVTNEYMPYLSGMGLEHRMISEVVPSPGYCERSEIFSGLGCCETGNFTAIGYDAGRAEYRDGIVLRLASMGAGIYKRGTKYLMNKYRAYRGIKLAPYYIPPKTLNRYFLTEDGDDRLIAHETLFDILDECGISYDLSGFTSLSLVSRNKGSVIDHVDHMTKNGCSFVPLYIGTPDVVGHKYGNDMDMIRPYLTQIDHMVAGIHHLCVERGYDLCVLGDHGMIPVSKDVDVLHVLASAGLKEGDGFEFFLDSAYARFWVDDEMIQKKIRDVLDACFAEDGIWLDESNCRMYGIPLDITGSEGKRIYGNMIWCANPGVLIFPDYFNNPTPRTKDKGMHGYLLNRSNDAYGFFVSTHGKEKNDRAKLSDICSELCACLECRIPNLTRGR